MAVSSIAFSPNTGTEARQLFVLLHGAGASPEALEPLGLALRMAFPGAVVLIPQGLEVCDQGGPGRQWYSERQPDTAAGDGVAALHAGRIAQAMPEFIEYVLAAQRRWRLRGADTALAGFAQGATMALEAVQAQPLLAGRVLAFAGRYASLPAMAPRTTTIHLLHGEQDEVVPLHHAQAAQQRLAELQGDATIDVASRIGHQLHPVLVRQAIVRLKTCVPLRKWAQAVELDVAPPAGATLH